MMALMRWLLAILLLAATAPSALAKPQRRSVTVDGRDRTYWLSLPVSPASRSPLVIALHGHGGNGTMMRRLSGLDALTERGAAVAYPDGTGWHGARPWSWNAGGCCGYAQSAQVDDLAFLRALIDDAGTVTPVDARRIYVTGVSNGAMLAHRAGCELAGIAAIAPVAGTLSVKACAPPGPVSVLAIHGTADGYVPYLGGHGPRRRDDRIDLAVGEAVARWARVNGCGEARDGPVPNTAERATRRDYDCPPGIGVSLVTIEGGGHAWPGGRRSWRFGDAPPALSANDLMWEFFEAHAAP